MKRSIKHLPKRTQEELNALLELITKYIPKCNLVALSEDESTTCGE